MNSKSNPIFSTLAEELQAPVISDLMAKALEQPDLLSLAAGFTDNKALPNEELNSLIQDLLKKDQLNESLQYGTTQGRETLRNNVAKFLPSYPNENSETFHSDNIFISNGSQQALYIAVQTLCNPGDILLVERPSYFVFLEMLKGLGVNAVGIPTLESGEIDMDAFSDLLANLKKENQTPKIKGLYLVSYHANPSSRCIPQETKRSVAQTLQQHNLQIPIIEDAAYRDLYYDTPYDAPSVLSIAEFQNFPCLYLGTFTKPFSTGLKCGYGICNHKEWQNKILYTKGHHDFGTANFNQAIIDKMLTEGIYPTFLKKLREHYKPKAHCLDDALRSVFGTNSGWEWDMPSGGLLFWLKGPSKMDTSIGSKFCNACLDNQVLYVPGNLCFPDPEETNYVRLSIGTLDPENLALAGKRFAETAKQFS